MIADLVKRLRDQAAVWERMDPIYGTTAGLEALLREAADRLAAAERVVEAARALIDVGLCDEQETFKALRKATEAYSGGTSTDHLVPAEGSGQEMLALRPDAAPDVSHRSSSYDPNRLADETDDLDAYLERRRKRTDLNSEKQREDANG